MLIQSIVDLDKELLLFLNSFHNNFFDAFMWMISSKEIWLPLYLSVIYYFFKNTDRKKAFYILGACILCIVLCDQISASIFKPLFERWRPSRDSSISDLVHIVNGKRGGKYGFISSHAANVFGLAVFSALLFKNRLYSIVILSWAALVSYSRVYLGVHFPGDILCGGALGALLGYALYKGLGKFVDVSEEKKTSLSIFLIVIAVTIFSILSVSRYMHFAN
jgi:undecaprenyl-diphosphatase